MPGYHNKSDRLHHMTAGLEFIATFGLLLALGIFLDRRMNSMPGFTLLGGTVGFAAGLYRLWKQAKQTSDEAADGQSDDDQPPER